MLCLTVGLSGKESRAIHFNGDGIQVPYFVSLDYNIWPILPIIGRFPYTHQAVFPASHLFCVVNIIKYQDFI